MQLTTLAIGSAIFACGCAADIAPQSAGDDIFTGASGNIITTRNGDGTYTSILDASRSDTWTAIDLDRGGEVTDSSDASWDLAGQRFHLRLNGTLLSGTVQVRSLGDVDLSAAPVPADGPWLEDLVDGDDENDLPDYAFEQGDGWYDYDATTHVLTARPITWLVRTGEGALRVVRIESYYDSAGTAARLRMRWKPSQSEAQTTGAW
jgi:hypothetical protein